MSKLNLIEDYFEGRMSTSEMNEFEARLEKDPELKREFDLQKEIIDTIKNVRKAELKARLDNVHIGGGISSNFSFSKIISTIAIIGVIGVGGYFMLNQIDPVADREKKTQQPTDETIEEKTPEDPDKSLEDNLTDNEKVDKDKKRSDEVVEKEGTKNKQTKEKTVPQPVTPDVIEEFEDEEELTDVTIPENNLAPNSNFNRSTIDIEVNEDSKYDFHYQYKDGKLFLYGDFTDTEEPYQILELKNDSNQSMFFYYKQKFYTIDKTINEITPLIEITDEEINDRLREIKNKK